MQSCNNLEAILHLQRRLSAQIKFICKQATLCNLVARIENVFRLGSNLPMIIKLADKNKIQLAVTFLNEIGRTFDPHLGNVISVAKRMSDFEDASVDDFHWKVSMCATCYRAT